MKLVECFVLVESETGTRIRCALMDFLRDNRDGIAGDERRALVRTLRANEPAVIGGGAAPLTTVRLDPAFPAGG